MPVESALCGTPGTVHVSPGNVAGKLPSEQPKGRPYAHGWPRETIMTPDTQQARAGHRRPQSHGRDGGTTTRSGAPGAGAARTGNWGAAAQPSPAFTQTRASARRAREDARIVRLIPLLTVLVLVAAGVYIAWRQGSAGGGAGGGVGGGALLGAGGG